MKTKEPKRSLHRHIRQVSTWSLSKSTQLQVSTCSPSKPTQSPDKCQPAHRPSPHSYQNSVHMFTVQAHTVTRQVSTCSPSKPTQSQKSTCSPSKPTQSPDKCPHAHHPSPHSHQTSVHMLTIQAHTVTRQVSTCSPCKPTQSPDKCLHAHHSSPHSRKCQPAHHPSPHSHKCPHAHCPSPHSHKCPHTHCPSPHSQKKSVHMLIVQAHTVTSVHMLTVQAHTVKRKVSTCSPSPHSRKCQPAHCPSPQSQASTCSPSKLTQSPDECPLTHCLSPQSPDECPPTHHPSPQSLNRCPHAQRPCPHSHQTSVHMLTVHSPSQLVLFLGLFRSCRYRGEEASSSPVARVICNRHVIGAYRWSISLLLLLVTYIQCYSPLSSRLTVLLSYMVVNEWLAFHSAFLNIHWGSVLTALFGCYMAGAMWNCCHLGTHCVHHTTMHHETS